MSAVIEARVRAAYRLDLDVMYEPNRTGGVRMFIEGKIVGSVSNDVHKCLLMSKPFRWIPASDGRVFHKQVQRVTERQAERYHLPPDKLRHG